jgi:hypothetical protein
MNSEALDLLDAAGGYATTKELLTVMTRQQLDVQVRKGGLVRVWHGVYAGTTPSMMGRLKALDIFIGTPAVACLGTAAALYGFDVENTTTIHVLDPGRRMRSTVGLMVHQRTGAPIEKIPGGSQPLLPGLPSRLRVSCRAIALWLPLTPLCMRRVLHRRSLRQRSANSGAGAG